MSNNNEIKIKISADDLASQVFRNVAKSAKAIEQGFRSMASVGASAASSADKASVSAQKMGQGFQSAANAGGSMVSSSQKASNAVQKMGQSFQSATISAAGFVAAIAGLQGAAAIINKTLGSVVSFSRSMETNQIGIAGILSSMTTLNGKNLEWNQALGISRNLMQQLSNEALRTNATTEELVTTFRALLGPGLGAGMKVNEIVKLSSVGATAVKSLGLNGTQLVQELRDLVQGGIQPASSSLATALGLTDKDIKEAKASSEGLFNFLMKRLEGFAAAGDASKKTMDGIIDQIQEGVQRIGAQGTAPIYGAVKMELAEIANGLVTLNKETNEVQLNPQLVNDLTYASKKVVEIGGEFAEIGQAVGTVAVPAAKAFGDTLVIAGENAKTIITILSGLYAANKITGLYRDIAGAATGAVSANSMLGKAVLAVRNSYTAQAAAAKAAAQQEMQAAMQAAANIQASEKTQAAAKAARLKESQMLTATIIKAEQAGWMGLGVTLRNLQSEYMKLGVSAEQAGAMQMQAAKVAQAGQFALAQSIIATQKAHIQAAASANASAVIAVSGAGKAAGAIKTLSSAVWALAGGWVGVATAIGYALYQLYEFGNNQNKIKSYNKNAEVYYRNGKYYKRVWEAGKSDDPYDRMRSGGGVNSGRYVEKELSAEEYKAQYEHDQKQKDKAEELRKLISGEWREQQEKTEEQLKQKFQKSNDDAEKKELREAKEQMRREIKEAELFYKAQSDKLKAEREAIKKSHDPNGDLKDYAVKLAQAERNIIDSDIAKIKTEIDIVNKTPFENAQDKELKIKELNIELAKLAEKAKNASTAFQEISTVTAKISGDDIINAAEKKLGTPYVLGADGVSATDCGKYVQDVWNQVGVEWSTRYVPYMIEEAKKKGLWREVGSGYTPKKGDGVVVLGDNHVGMSDGNGGIYHASYSRKRTVHDPNAEAAFGQATGYIAISELTKQEIARRKIMTQDASKKYQKEYFKMIDEGNAVLEEVAKIFGDVSTYKKKDIEKQYNGLIEKFKNNGQVSFAAAAEKIKAEKLWQADFAQVQHDLEKSNDDLANAQEQLFTEFAAGSKSSAEVAKELTAKVHELFDTKLQELNKQLSEAFERGSDEDVRKIRRQIKDVIDKITDGFKALLDKINAQTDEEIARVRLRKDLTAGQKDDLVEDVRQRGLRTKIGAAEDRLSFMNGIISSGDQAALAEFEEKFGDINTEIVKTKKELEQFNYELQQTPDLVDKIHLAGKQGLEDGLNGFFYDLAMGCKNVSDAFRDLANNILQSITKVLSNRLTMQFMSFMGYDAKSSSISISAGAGIGGVSTGGLFANGGNINGGGKVTGPGTNTSDSILAWSSRFGKFIGLSDEEYVIRAQAVKKFGTRFMDYINNGMIPPEIYKAREMYARGGNISGTDIKIPTPSTTNHVSVPVNVSGVDSSSSMSSEMRREIEDVVIKVLRKYS